MRGIIVKGIGGFYYVKAEDGILYECKARGIFRKNRIKPTIGDKVEMTVSNGKGSIDDILKRKNILIRPPVSNVDNILIVTSQKEPDADVGLIDKILITAEYKGIQPAICINKTDIDKGNDLLRIYKNTGYRIFNVSTYENSGIGELRDFLVGKVTAFAGNSGVGKSSLINSILKENAETGDISDKIKRGKHTTRHVELFEIEEGGYIFDTPGFSTFEIEGIKPDELCMQFPEMRNCRENCRFSGCVHINEPDCAVKNLVGNILPIERYNSYKTIYNDIKDRKEWK